MRPKRTREENQAPGGRAKTYRCVKVDPKPMGNGRRDRGDRRITLVGLARNYELIKDWP